MRASRQLLYFLLLYAAIFPGRTAWACPGCKEGVADQPGSHGAGLRQGYFWSILLMAGMPFGLGAAGGLALVRAAKRGMLPQI